MTRKLELLTNTKYKTVYRSRLFINKTVFRCRETASETPWPEELARPCHPHSRAKANSQGNVKYVQNSDHMTKINSWRKETSFEMGKKRGDCSALLALHYLFAVY